MKFNSSVKSDLTLELHLTVKVFGEGFYITHLYEKVIIASRSFSFIVKQKEIRKRKVKYFRNYFGFSKNTLSNITYPFFLGQ